MADPPSPSGVVTDVVTCFLRNRGEVLLVRRSGRVGTYRGRWGAVSGYCEAEDPLDDALREISEETGLEGAVTLVRRGEPFAFTDAGSGRDWRVHPFLFDVSRRHTDLDWEADQGAWVAPTEILERDCVPHLWTSYLRVAPSLREVRDDREHGSAYLSLRALEVLRDRAASLARGAGSPSERAAPPADDGGAAANPLPELVALAKALREVRPAMTALRNRIDGAMTDALGGPVSGRRLPTGIEGARGVAGAAHRALLAALAAEDGAARRAAQLVRGRAVLTLSLSGTVVEALIAAEPAPARVVVLESLPGSEGRALVRRLERSRIDAVLVPDAAVAWAIERYRPDIVLVGADTVLPDGAVVNKVGTRPAALAARDAGVPVFAAATRDKVAAGGWAHEHEGSAVAPEGDGHVRAWRSPLFERTPAALLEGIVTEAGVLSPPDVAAIAAEHAGRAGWID